MYSTYTVENMLDIFGRVSTEGDRAIISRFSYEALIPTARLDVLSILKKK